MRRTFDNGQEERLLGQRGNSNGAIGFQLFKAPRVSGTGTTALSRKWWAARVSGQGRLG